MAPPRLCALVMIYGGIALASQTTPVTPQTFLAEAKQQLAQSHLPEAERQLRAALAVDPASTEAHYLLGYVLFREDRAQDSLAEYTAGARGRPPSAEELITVASDYVLLKDFPDVAKWLNYALKLDPANARAWYLLGRTQYNQDQLADAQHSFERVLTLRPHDVRAEYNLGLVDEKMQRPGDAEKAYRQAIAWQSGLTAPDPQPYLDLGVLLLSRGSADEALGMLQEAVQYGPGNPLAHQELGRALESLGRYEEALVALRRAIALAPDAQQPHFFIARILKRLGHNQEANAEYAVVAKMLGTHSDSPTPNAESKP